MAAPPPPGIDELMRQFLDCEDAAFGTLAQALRREIEADLRGRGASADLAEEIADQTLVRLFEQKYPPSKRGKDHVGP